MISDKKLRKKFDIIILGYYGFGNLGDELLAEAVIGLLTEAGVSRDRIAILSASPKESEEKFSVRAFNRWNIGEVSALFSRGHSLLLGGGGLFQDSTSLRSCLYYYAMVRLAKLKGLKIWAAGQSVGPLHRKAAKYLTKSALGCCDYLSVRDEASFKAASELSLDAKLSHDLVTSLALDPKVIGSDDNSEEVILFNARPGYDNIAEDAARKTSELADKTCRPLKGSAFADEDAKEISRLCERNLINIRDIITVKSLNDFCSAAKGASGAVGMRLHFLLLSALAGIPLAGAAYDPKVSGFCRKYGFDLTDGAEITLSCGDRQKISEAALKSKEDFTVALKSILGESNE